MPLPVALAILAGLGGIGGVSAGASGTKKIIDAKEKSEWAQETQEKAIKKFESSNIDTIEIMDKIGRQELEILKSFEEFSDIINEIQGRPEFKNYSKSDINIPKYEADELKNISAGAAVLLGGIGGAAAGTAGGFAAAGATTSAIMALGTASTGTAISSLSGVAATNATLAALGGGSIAAGGGGMALGSAVLGGTTLGVGLLIGGIIFNIAGAKISDQADELYSQAAKTEKEVEKIVAYLEELHKASMIFKRALTDTEKQYRKHLNMLKYIVDYSEKTNWKDFSEKEKKVTENTILLVGLLYKMCRVNLVCKGKSEADINEINYAEIDKIVSDATGILDGMEDVA